MKDEMKLGQIIANSPVKVGEKYRHYKTQDIYVVRSLAFREADLELCVIYSRENSNLVWVRTLTNFTEKVRDENNQMVERFKKIKEEIL